MGWKAKEILEGIVAAGVVLGGVYTFGQFNGRLDQLEKQQAVLENHIVGLENRVDPIRAIKTGKGDLCLAILNQQAGANNVQRRQQLQQQWDREGCEGLPANAATKVTDAVPENAVQNER